MCREELNFHMRSYNFSVIQGYFKKIKNSTLNSFCIAQGRFKII